MNSIYLIRHAESQDSEIEQRWQGQATNPHLTIKGKLQSKELTQFLKDIEFDIIFSSPLLRCIDTSKEILNHKKVRFEIIENLKEFNFGIFDNLTKPEILDKYTEIYQERKKDEYNISIPNGESFKDVEKRLRTVVKRIINNKKNCLIICHAHIIRVLCMILTEIPFEEAIKIRFKNASITKINLEDKKKGTIEYINKVSSHE